MVQACTLECCDHPFSVLEGWNTQQHYMMITFCLHAAYMVITSCLHCAYLKLSWAGMKRILYATICSIYPAFCCYMQKCCPICSALAAICNDFWWPKHEQLPEVSRCKWHCRSHVGIHRSLSAAQKSSHWRRLAMIQSSTGSAADSATIYAGIFLYAVCLVLYAMWLLLHVFSYQMQCLLLLDEQVLRWSWAELGWSQYYMELYALYAVRLSLYAHMLLLYAALLAAICNDFWGT